MQSERRQAFEDQVARVRAAAILGRSQGLERLFDYLADPVRAGASLREAEIALDVFGRAPGPGEDASIRVYVHRLRRKLEAFYEGPGAGEPHRLRIPLGEYRLEVEPSAARAAPRSVPSRRGLTLALGGLAIAAGAGAAGFGLAMTMSGRDAMARVAGQAPWAGLGRDRPVFVVVGDYYIFGDTEGAETPRRMIRAFEINSPADLDAWLMDNPTFQGRYIDLDTYYAPTGAAAAVAAIMPIVRRAAGRARIQVVTASHLTPEMLKTADVVYVGYLSGLRLLLAPVFERSRYMIGPTFDELVDRRTGATFVSGAGSAPGDRANRDYGYVAAFQSAGGGRVIVISGARDIGVIQSAEIAADPDALRRAGAAEGRSFEALFEVDGVGRTPIGARQIGAN